jgi:hypothetical protein
VEAPLQIKSTWFNESIQEEEFSTTTIYVPQGNYTYSSMLAFLNGSLPKFFNEPYPNTVYGLGGEVIPSPIPANVPVTKSPINTTLIFNQFANLLTQVIPSPVNEHIYTSFEIVTSREVYRLFVLLGLVKIQNPNVNYSNPSSFIIRIGIDSRIYSLGVTTMVYNVINEIVAPYSFDFSGTKSLYVYLESPVNSQFRAPFENNNASNLIARVPLNVPFGFQYSYLAQQVVFSQQRNMNISQLLVTCRDDYGDFVDFQNLPWFIELSVKFGLNESNVSVSGTQGVPSNLASAPNMHPSALSYNSGDRDMLMGSQNNPVKTNKRSKRDDI